MKPGTAAATVAAALLTTACGPDGPDPSVAQAVAAGGKKEVRDGMADGCTRLTVTQTGGFAGNVALPPLVDLDRARLDAAGRAAMDDACRRLTAAAQSSAAPAAIGADLGGYRVEMIGPAGDAKSFALPGPEATAGLAGQLDVPQLLAPLLPLSSGTP